MQHIINFTQPESSRQVPAELSSDQNSSHVVFEIELISLTSNTFSTPELILYKLVTISYLNNQ